MINIFNNHIFFILFCIATTNILAQDYKKIDSLINVSKSTEIDTVMVKLYLELGAQYESSLPESALVYYKMALTLSEKIGSKKQAAACLNNIGNSFLDQGNYDKAVEYYLQSLLIYEKQEDKTGIAKSYNNIGIVYWYQKNYDKTIEYFQNSLKISEELEDKNGMAKCYNNIGMVYSEQNIFDKALEYYQKSLEIFEDTKDKRAISACYVNIGIDYKLQGNFNKALEYYQKSLKIKIELEDKKGISIVFFSIASLNLELKEFIKAIEYATNGLDIAKEINSLALQHYAYQILFTANDSLHNYQNAFEFHKLYKQINDSIYTEKNSMQINEILTKYQTEKKEQQIALQEVDMQKKRMYLIFMIIMSAAITAALAFVIRSNIITRRKNEELEDARKKIKILSGFLPICSYCKKIRNDDGSWAQMESYIDKHSEAKFSHSICPTCMDKYFPE